MLGRRAASSGQQGEPSQMLCLADSAKEAWAVSGWMEWLLVSGWKKWRAVWDWMKRWAVAYPACFDLVFVGCSVQWP